MAAMRSANPQSVAAVTTIGRFQELKENPAPKPPKAACTPLALIDDHQEPPINWMQGPVAYRAWRGRKA